MKILKNLDEKTQRIIIIVIFSLFLFNLFIRYIQSEESKEKINNDQTTTLVISDEEAWNYENTKIIYDDFLAINFDGKLPEIKEKISDKNLSNYTKLFKEIIETIQRVDRRFNPKDYKLYHHIVNDENKIGFIYFIYYINNKIETNKVYIIDFEDTKITNITLGGIREKNIKNMSTVNINNLEKKIKGFEKDKVNILFGNSPKVFKTKDILDKKGNVKKENIEGNVVELDEEYHYDYNTNKLVYRLKYVIEHLPISILDTESVEIEI